MRAIHITFMESYNKILDDRFVKSRRQLIEEGVSFEDRGFGSNHIAGDEGIVFFAPNTFYEDMARDEKLDAAILVFDAEMLIMKANGSIGEDITVEYDNLLDNIFSDILNELWDANASVKKQTVEELNVMNSAIKSYLANNPEKQTENVYNAFLHHGSFNSCFLDLSNQSDIALKMREQFKKRAIELQNERRSKGGEALKLLWQDPENLEITVPQAVPIEWSIYHDRL